MERVQNPKIATKDEGLFLIALPPSSKCPYKYATSAKEASKHKSQNRTLLKASKLFNLLLILSLEKNDLFLSADSLLEIRACKIGGDRGFSAR